MSGGVVVDIEDSLRKRVAELYVSIDVADGDGNDNWLAELRDELRVVLSKLDGIRRTERQ